MHNVLPFRQPAPEVESIRQEDAAARAAALDAQSSVLVEAPAGSGKTGLMVQRFLHQLLDPEVTRPSEVMAITFTRKATEELRERVVKELESAYVEESEKASDFARSTRDLARQVRERSDASGWDLLRAPASMLNIRSIDSACMTIAMAAPVVSGIGGPRKVTQDAEPLYRTAARRTLFQLGGHDSALSGAIRQLLLHRDGQLEDLERLLAHMLGSRELWGELIPLRPELLTPENLDNDVRPRLEAALEAIVCAGLENVRRLMPSSALEELSRLASAWSDVPASDGTTFPLQVCGQFTGAPEARAECLEHWRALIRLLLTKEGNWRRSFANNHLKLALPKSGAGQLKEIVQTIEEDRLGAALQAVVDLPPAKYPDEQWEVAKALFRVLRHALIELKLLFAERGECDFAEVSLAARSALQADPTFGDQALAGGDGRLRHLLVDEMQDTSAAQYNLLEQLTRSWDGRTQTLFAVGDPKQSIYMFRQARVERFLEVMSNSALGELRLTPLHLRLNFRTQASLVHAVNALFDGIFPALADLQRGDPDVPFAAAGPTRKATTEAALQWHTRVLASAPDGGRPDRALHQKWEARSVVDLVREWRGRPLPGGRRPWSIAVLASTRTHMTEIARQLRAAAIPFSAVDVEPLGERIEVLDCVALTRALMHPADRIAWLAVLRAPWCGLSMTDLLTITGDGPDADRTATVAELVEQNGKALSPDARAHLDRVWPILQSALEARGRSTLTSLAERAWWTLGGDLACTEPGRRNVQRYFALLGELEQSSGGARVDLRLLDARLSRLYAEEAALPAGQPSVELMTIHRAKGLEWDFVVVPSMERPVRGDREELLNWIELDSVGAATASHILLAPIASSGEPSLALNRWISKMRSARQDAERKRLFYVACTRAREELHLFAAVSRKKDAAIAKPAAGALLSVCWAAVEREFGIQDEETTPANVSEELQRTLDRAQGFALAAAEDPLVAGIDSADKFAREPVHRERLRSDVRSAERFSSPGLNVPLARAAELQRPEGSLAARAFGNVVHRALDLAAKRLSEGFSPEALQTDVESWQPRLTTLLRSEGLAASVAAQEALEAQRAVLQTLQDPLGRWTLERHPQADAEWAVGGTEGSLRADRIFLAGAEPGSYGESHAWIIDFKTTRRGSREEANFRAAERSKYGPQLERYARARRLLCADGKIIRLGLFYPLDGIFLEWESDVSGRPELLSGEPELSHPDGMLIAEPRL